MTARSRSRSPWPLDPARAARRPGPRRPAVRHAPRLPRPGGRTAPTDQAPADRPTHPRPRPRRRRRAGRPRLRVASARWPSGPQLVALAEAEAPLAVPPFVLDEPGLVGGLRSEVPLPADQVVDVRLVGPRRHRAERPHRRPRLRSRRLAGRDAGRARLLSMPLGADVTGSAGAARRLPRARRLGRLGRGAHRRPDGRVEGPATGASSPPSGASWCRTAATRSCCAARRSSRPVCGLAMHDETQADHVFTLTRELAEKIHDQVMGIRLSVGACPLAPFRRRCHSSSWVRTSATGCSGTATGPVTPRR